MSRSGAPSELLYGPFSYGIIHVVRYIYLSTIPTGKIIKLIRNTAQFCIGKSPLLG